MARLTTQCPKCSTRYSARSGLRRHMREKHPGVPMPQTREDPASSSADSSEDEVPQEEGVQGNPPPKIVRFKKSKPPAKGGNASTKDNEAPAKEQKTPSKKRKAPVKGYKPPAKKQKSNGELVCPEAGCKKPMASAGILRNHLSNVHGKDKTLCSECGKYFSKARHAHHLRDVHGEASGRTCDICSKTFTSLSTLRRHKREVHIADQSFPCPQCEQVFPRKRALQTHILSRHQGDYILWINHFNIRG